MHYMDNIALMSMEKCDASDSAKNSIHQGTLEKLDIPPSFKGNFGDLFTLLLNGYGVAAIAIYR